MRTARQQRPVRTWICHRRCSIELGACGTVFIYVVLVCLFIAVFPLRSRFQRERFVRRSDLAPGESGERALRLFSFSTHHVFTVSTHRREDRKTGASNPLVWLERGASR
jgi:hypothetical protein